jgi:hypothetical protein
MKDSEIQLYELMKKRITTTMIGALASIEKMLDLEDEEYEDLRQDILDKGNAQIRELRKDLECYEVKYRKIYFIPLRRDHDKRREI